MGMFATLGILGGSGAYVMSSRINIKKGVIMKNQVMILLTLIFGLMASNVQAIVCSNQLQEIYHHKNGANHCLEIAYLLLLFTSEFPESAYSPQDKLLANGMHQLTFTFENASAGYNLLKRVQACKGDGYMINLHAHGKNLVLVIMYDPNRIDVRYDRYIDLDLRKGFIVRFFDHTLLSTINNKESYILQTAAMGMYHAFSPIRLLV